MNKLVLSSLLPLGLLLVVLPTIAAPTRVIEIKVPEPSKPPPPPPPPGAPLGPDGQPAPQAAAERPAMNPLRPGVRREKRKVDGGAPTFLAGRYHVVEVTEHDETEDFKIKMEREGKALDQDCITIRLVFDFGGGENEALPPVLQVAEQQQCQKGGLGVYASELALAMPATWSTGSSVRLSLPPIEARGSLVRVRKPESGDLHTPSHWLGPEAKVDRPPTEYEVVAEYPKARPKPGAPPVAATAVHLIAGGVVWHLEPEPLDGPFVVK